MHANEDAMNRECTNTNTHANVETRTHAHSNEILHLLVYCLERRRICHYKFIMQECNPLVDKFSKKNAVASVGMVWGIKVADPGAEGAMPPPRPCKNKSQKR